MKFVVPQINDNFRAIKNPALAGLFYALVDFLFATENVSNTETQVIPITGNLISCSDIKAT